MKLMKYKTSLTTERKYPGLFEAKFTHEIKETKGDLKYIGPKIPPEVWDQILSFFAWTYEKTKSESQAKLYVNPVLGKWGAWVFPQKANTGMTAHELTLAEIKEEFKRDVMETDEMAKTRFEFWGSQPSDDWRYGGTVHHHCACGAFQSGTDENNERDQEGLHITVGNIDRPRHDLHCRFYLNGCQFDPDMSLFWDIGADMRERTPEALWDIIARYQMGKASKSEFPQLWKDNLIEVKQRTYVQGGHFRYDGGTGYISSGTGATVPYNHGGFNDMPIWSKAKMCYECIVRELASDGYTYKEIVDNLNNIQSDEISENIMTNCEYFHIDFSDLYREWPTESKELEAIAAAALKAGNYDEAEDLDEIRHGRQKASRRHSRSKKEDKPSTPSQTNQQGGSPAAAGDDMADMSCLD